MRERPAPLGASGNQSLASSGKYAPSSSLSQEYESPRGTALQTFLDVAMIVSVAMLVIVTGIAITAATFILFFVDLH